MNIIAVTIAVDIADLIAVPVASPSTTIPSTIVSRFPRIYTNPPRNTNMIERPAM